MFSLPRSLVAESHDNSYVQHFSKVAAPSYILASSIESYSPYPCQHLLSSVFWIIAILVRVNWDLVVLFAFLW